MPSFAESQKQYTEAKLLFEKAVKENYLARQQILVIDNQIAAFLKDNLLATLPAAHPLNQQKNDAATRLTNSQTAVTAAQTSLNAAREALKTHGPANQTISNFNDAFPILLLPLRLQTRFLTTKHIARNIPEELLIDINKVGQADEIRALFPDLKPLADPLASISSQAYSLSHHPAPAVKDLISRIDAVIEGPAFQKRWLKVEDTYELIVRIFPDDLFLQSHETALTEQERSAGKTFWQRMWTAERTFRQNPAAAGAQATKDEKQLEAWKTLRFDVLPHRASWIVRIMKPAGYPDNLGLELETIPDQQFPVTEIKAESWTLPPQTELLPEQFMVKVFFSNADIAPKEVIGAAIPDYVQLGFDPYEQDENAFGEKGRVLELPKEIRWLTDLAEAEKCGMAVRIPISTAEFASGISKLVVLGVKTGADAAEGARLARRLIENHRYKPDGMAFLPQGTSTNNLPDQPSGFSQAGLSDAASFRLEFPLTTKIDASTDGQWFATALGLEATDVINIANHEKREATQVIYANRALWPATLGYYLDNFMRPAITDADIGFVKSFFQQFVYGRGTIPSFRAGKQPYGIVPATAWSAWKPAATASKEELRLVEFLKKMDFQYERLVGRVKTMKKVFENTNEDTLTREFRSLLAYQASSTRYFRRLVAGEYLLWNVNQRANPLGFNKAGIFTTPREYHATLQGAAGWNENVPTRPRILGKFMDDENYKLTDAPLPQVQTNAPTAIVNRNYLPLLVNATLEQLRTSNFGEQFGQFVIQRSSRLMFHLARFALVQGWIEAAINLVRLENQGISPLAKLDFEMEYVNSGNIPSMEHQSLLTELGQDASLHTLKNKWAFLEQTLADGTRVDEKITQKIKEAIVRDDPARTLKEVRSSLAALAGLPLEGLERLFSEHLDLCSFRLDAWLQGLVLARLFTNRKKAGLQKGVFLGAYGYLENLRPGAEPWVRVKEIAKPEAVFPGSVGSGNVVMPVYDFSGYTADQLAAVRKFVFVYLGSDPVTYLVQDPENKQIVQTLAPGKKSEDGFLLTPSLEHAATAGILRAGYEHHQRSQGPGSKTLSVSIDSKRSGLAMDMLKATKAGHSLNEQLGYFIERKMFDSVGLAQFVPNLRNAFPMHIERNEWDNDQNINEKEKITNLALVTDGLTILNKKETPQNAPTWDTKLTEIFGGDQAAKLEFAQVVEQAADQFDAISDLVLAEGVFQMVKGSPDRAAAAMRMVSEGADVQLPEIVSIPSDSKVLTHRMGLVLNHANPLEKPWPVANGKTSVWTRLSPDFNQWLVSQLPLPAKVFVSVVPQDKAPVKVSMGTLGLQPIDLYYLVQKTGGRPEESLLAWFAKEAARKMPGMDAASFQISFDRDPGFGPDEFSIREIVPLTRTIAALLDKSRFLRPEDWQIMANTAAQTSTSAYDHTILKAACSEFANNLENGPIPAYLKRLTAARSELEQKLPTGFGSTDSETAFHNLMRIIPEAFFTGIWDAVPRCPEVCNQANAMILLEQASDLILTLQKRLDQAVVMNADISGQAPATAGDKMFDMLSKLAHVFTGEDFLVLPRFSITNAAEINLAFNDETLAKNMIEFEVEEWLQRLALVRENARNYQMLTNLRSIYNAPAGSRQLKILQLPQVPGTEQHWIGGLFPEGFVPPPNVTSLAFEFSTPFTSNQAVAGILIDDWREKVPMREMTCGVSINYNQSNNEAPQCCLLAVAPEQKGAWDWNALLQSILETMTLAKKRAIDTEILQPTWLNQFLPAVVTPYDAKNNTPNLDFRVAGPPIITINRPDIDIGHTGGIGNVILRGTNRP